MIYFQKTRGAKDLCNFINLHTVFNESEKKKKEIPLFEYAFLKSWSSLYPWPVNPQIIVFSLIITRRDIRLKLYSLLHDGWLLYIIHLPKKFNMLPVIMMYWPLIKQKNTEIQSVSTFKCLTGRHIRIEIDIWQDSCSHDA